MFYDVKNISIFGDSYAVFDMYFPEVVEAIDEDRRDVLRHFNDFDTFRFCVINDSSVLVYDDICGDIVGRFESLEEFRDTVLQEVENEI